MSSPQRGVSLQWNLDRTTNNSFSVAQGVIRAATSDNVQALALLACEKFGSTLAICQETSLKIEDLMVKVSGPTLVRFLGAQIGYAADDCATELSCSLAGNYFLALAAALISSTSLFDGANAISIMLKDTAVDKTVLPTSRQVKDLLAALEHRLNRSGFTDLCMGYHWLLSGIKGIAREHYLFWENGYPTPEGIAHLVNAFRQLDRVGEAIAVTIRASLSMPWVMAFTRWCLGIPPRTILDDGTVLLDQPNARVTLVGRMATEKPNLEITIHKGIASLDELLELQEGTGWIVGLVTVETLGHSFCQNLGGKEALEYRALAQALPYALNQTLTLLRVRTSWRLAKSTVKHVFKDSACGLAAKPFPPDPLIYEVLGRFLQLEPQQTLPTLKEGQTIFDMPLVEMLYNRMKKECPCKQCDLDTPTIKTVRKGQSPYTECNREKFLWRLADQCVEILNLSLFEGPSNILAYHKGHKGSRGTFQSRVKLLLETGQVTECDMESIVVSALDRIGHRTNDAGTGVWVVSSFQGQAVYPRIFESEDFFQEGFLMMHWAPGVLHFDTESYHRGVFGSGSISSGMLLSNSTSELPVTKIFNSVSPTRTMEWRVSPKEDHLGVWLSTNHYTGSPFFILRNLCSCLILRSCSHDEYSPLCKPDKFAQYTDPAHAEAFDEPKIGVLAVAGNTGLKMFAMSHNSALKSVIRQNACLKCCLDLCREYECNVLIC